MATDINSVVLVGRLTKDCQTRQAGQSTVTSFSVAVNRRKKQGDQWVEEVSYFDIEVWNTKITQYLAKGRQVAVDGELRQDRWESDGKTQSKVYVVAGNVQLLGGDTAKREDSGLKPVPKSYAAPTKSDDFFDDGDDIPF